MITSLMKTCLRFCSKMVSFKYGSEIPLLHILKHILKQNQLISEHDSCESEVVILD